MGHFHFPYLKVNNLHIVYVCFWSDSDHLFYLTSLHSSLPQLCKRTHPLCIFAILVLLTLSRSVLINHPSVTYAHCSHQSSLKTPTFQVQGLPLKQSGDFPARSRARCSHGDCDLNYAKRGERKREKTNRKEGKMVKKANSWKKNRKRRSESDKGEQVTSDETKGTETGRNLKD